VEYVVADAVAVEPVSTVKFPANREKNREFCKIAASGAPETLNSSSVAGLPMQIPYSTKQGILLTEQGILTQEQGILPAKIEIIAR
jgi:hypothetical protein